MFKKFSSTLIIFAVAISLIVLSEIESKAQDCGGCGQSTCEGYFENGDGAYEADENDIDDDGVMNGDDECEDTPAGEIVDPSNGCSIKQLVPCEGPKDTTDTWKNHGKYVSTLAKTANSFVKQGLITEEEKDELMEEMASSDCGK